VVIGASWLTYSQPFLMAEKHSRFFVGEELGIIRVSLRQMVGDLDTAIADASDPPDRESVVHLTTVVRNGRRGRPRLELNAEFLEFSYPKRPTTSLGEIFGCSSRHVRRMALRNGLASPGEPVKRTITNADGSLTTVYVSSAGAQSTLSDAELDQLVRDVLEMFPNFGQRMLKGHFLSMGHNVPRQRLRHSHVRVVGVGQVFGRRRIARRTYSVPGPNSLWHHDGQHGMLGASVVHGRLTSLGK
jgi:hypothetical protein